MQMVLEGAVAAASSCDCSCAELLAAAGATLGAAAGNMADAG